MPYTVVHANLSSIWFAIANVVGDVLWIVAYILIIRQGFKNRTYGVPMLCIGLNFTWEILYAINFPVTKSNLIEDLRWAWLILDAVIVYQLLRFGRNDQNVPLIRQYFYPICAAMFVSTFIGQLAFHYSFTDKYGARDAYMINLVMSMLFIFLYFGRPSGAGLSIGAAWAKMLGTGILSFGSLFQITDWLKASFMVYLYVTIFVLDVIYIALLYRARAAAITKPEPSGMLAAA
jgi:hypothetical protein